MERKFTILLLQEIVAQNRAKEYNLSVAKKWMAEEQCVCFYVDGHVKVYYGAKANLPKKYIARQRLCMAGMMEYWVNNQKGAPYFAVIGEVNEKLKRRFAQSNSSNPFKRGYPFTYSSGVRFKSGIAQANTCFRSGRL